MSVDQPIIHEGVQFCELEIKQETETTVFKGLPLLDKKPTICTRQPKNKILGV